MAKIIDYTAVSTGNFKSFKDSVNKMIEEGWQPLGGISLAEWPDFIFTQAMVKYEP